MGWNSTRGRSWLASLLIVLSLAAQAAAQARFITPVVEAQPTSPIQEALRSAEQLEAQERWGEALAVYEETLREYPQDGELRRRADLAKIHYDLGRRYNDASFLRTIATLAERQAVALYSEVLTKIDSHYVGAPDWSGLVVRGTEDLELALEQKAFQQRNATGRSAAERAEFVRQLHGLAHSRPVRNRQQAVDFVAAAVQLGRQQLQMPPAAVAMEYACAAMGALDPYSTYLTSDQLNDVYSQIDGNFVGLGVELKASTGALQIVKVITGSPAERAGVRPGDRITKVDGRSTADMSTDQAADLLQGKEGTTVQVTLVAPSGQQRTVAVRREHIEVPSVDDVKMLDRESGVAYLKLTCFQKTTSRDLDTALWKLDREGMKSLIVDVRGNPGGLLPASVEVADKFLEEGIIVTTRGRNALEDLTYTAKKAGTWRMPLVVLIDGDSASASEIFAGAIHDHHRGTLVGQRSYGKGSVQGIFTLTSANAGLRLTTSKFFSPSGAAIAQVGVEPDKRVHLAARASDGQLAPFAAGDDPVLQAGLQEARLQLAARRR